MTLHKATIDDIADLIQLRFDFLGMMRGSALDENEKEMLRPQLDAYYRKHIPKNDFIALIIKKDTTIATAAFLTIDERPANLVFTNGVSGTLLNIITYPSFRRKGYARLILQEIISIAKERGVHVIDLMATADGFELYKKMGFKESTYPAMRFCLN